MPVKIRLPWKRQIAWTKSCHTKLLPDKFLQILLSLVAFASILKKLLTFKVPPPPRPLGLIGLGQKKKKKVKTIPYSSTPRAGCHAVLVLTKLGNLTGSHAILTLCKETFSQNSAVQEIFFQWLKIGCRCFRQLLESIMYIGNIF